MNPIHSLPSPVVVPAFGQGAPVQAPTRVEFDSAGMNTLAEAVLARKPFEQAGTSMLPTLRAPDRTAANDASVRDALALVANEQLPADAALQRSYERHVARAADVAHAVAASQDASDVRHMKFDENFSLMAQLVYAVQGARNGNRELGTKLVEMASVAREQVGDRLISQAHKNLIGTIVQGSVAVGFGAMGVGKSAQSARMTGDSARQNLMPKPPTAGAAAAPKPPAGPVAGDGGLDRPAQPGLDVPDGVARDGLPTAASGAPSTSASTSADDMAAAVPDQAGAAPGPASVTPASTPATPPSADAAPADALAPDATPAASVMDAMANAGNAEHVIASANANTVLQQGQFLNMIATPVSGTAASGAQVAAAADEAERLQLQASADAAMQVAGNQNEQASHDNDLRDAAFQAMQALARREATNSSIIQNI